MDFLKSRVFCSFKLDPRIFIFSIGLGADYSFEVKNIEIWVPAFFKHNNSSVATVAKKLKIKIICKLGLCLESNLSVLKITWMSETVFGIGNVH